VDFEAELISSLSEINKERRENKSLKEESIMLREGSRDVRQVFMNLKAQLDEANLLKKISRISCKRNNVWKLK
jgi:hypothetical protein